MEQTDKSFSELRVEANQEGLEEFERIKKIMCKKYRTADEEQEIGSYYSQDIWDFM